MEQIPNYGDERQLAWCIHCGGDTETRDHAPSRVFLDEPYPANLPVVPCCESCNEKFSLDEEYVSCLIECTLAGSANPDQMRRDKIKRILTARPALAARLAQAREEGENGVHLRVEMERVRNTMLKLARGHAAFELNEPQYEDPADLAHFPLALMHPDDRARFECPPGLSVWPEVGSRAMQRLLVGGGTVEHPGWIVVQPGRYRYLTAIGDGVIVRIVLSEYLGCEAVWSI